MPEYIQRDALMEKFPARSPLLMQIRAYIAAEPAADVALLEMVSRMRGKNGR